ncbi:MAG: hypothetical protein ABIO16_08585 [Nocardioides sp.]
MGPRLWGDTRRSDVAVVGVLAAMGVYLMVENIRSYDTAVRIESHSWLMLPVWLGAVLPLLWWRRAPLAVAVLITAVMGVHLLAFGWVGRCGSGLPLVWVVAYLVGTRDVVRRSLLGLAAAQVLGVLVLVKDAAAGPEILPFVAVLTAVIWGIGRLARQRIAMADELRIRTEELAVLRDRRAALEVTEDRARMSLELDALLRDRLGQLARAASAAPEGYGPADVEATHALMAGIEAESRQTLSEMRDIVGVLRGGEPSLTPSLTPAPSVAHLDALLARRTGSDARLTVSGVPRALPASVELSAYRIIEHLLEVLGDDAGSPVEVGVTFEDEALEIRVSGPVHRGSDVRGAVARARERARLQEGTLHVKVARGRARAVAQVPLKAA